MQYVLDEGLVSSKIDRFLSYINVALFGMKWLVLKHFVS